MIMQISQRHLIPASLCVATLGVLCYAVYKAWTGRRESASSQSGPLHRLVPVDVSLVSTEADWETAYNKLCQDLRLLKVLGFDCEWVSSPPRGRHPVSLLQLSSSSGLCVLVRQSLMERPPDSLTTLLADKSILKVGVACLDDAKKLSLDHGLIVRGCVDLRHLAARSRITNCRGYGLKDLAANVLGVLVDKEDGVRRSNWEDDLSDTQVLYAALDALVAVHLFMALIGRKLPDLLTRWRQLSTKAESDDEILWQRALSVCQGIVDVGFSLKAPRQSKPAGGSARQAGRAEKASRAYVPRKQPLYQNCRLLAPDDQLLATCDRKKAEWYLENDLAEEVCEDPLTVRLKFEPAGRPLEENSYYALDKENICAVCGSDDNVIRKSIVPHEYRKYFPSVMKNHKSHDVVLLCVPCHQLSSYYDSSLRQRLARECDAPLGAEGGMKSHQDPQRAKVRSAAKALLHNAAKIPAARLEELTETVKCHFGVDTVDSGLLQEATEMDISVANDAFVCHGQKVVQHVMEHEGLIAFEKLWRQHFLDSLKPEHLPALWSVDHCHEELSQLDRDLKDIISHNSVTS